MNAPLVQLLKAARTKLLHDMERIAALEKKMIGVRSDEPFDIYFGKRADISPSAITRTSKMRRMWTARTPR